MRIKTLPRHRMLRNSIKSATSSSEESDTDVGKDCDSVDAKDDQDLCQAYSSNILIPSKSHLPFTTFTSSNDEMTLSSSTSTSLSLINDDNNNVQVMNLSTKDTSNRVDDTDTSAEPEDKLKNSFLYKLMTDPNFLKNLQRNKQQPKKFICHFCKKGFSTSEELTNHMDVKKNESNQIICCACNKTFAQKRYLKYHQKRHSERIKFTCDICTKIYTRLDNLTRHNILHVNPTKFCCKMCNKTFTRKDLFDKHLKSHEKHSLYCIKCGKYFKSMLTMETHQKVHRKVSNASANIVVYKTESSVAAENLICKTENSASAKNKVHETHDSILC